jgi:hypothetical protein
MSTDPELHGGNGNDAFDAIAPPTSSDAVDDQCCDEVLHDKGKRTTFLLRSAVGGKEQPKAVSN